MKTRTVVADGLELLRRLRSLVRDLAQIIREARLIAFIDQIHDRNPFEFAEIFVAENIEIGLVGVDMHAVQAVADGLARALGDGAVLMLDFLELLRNLPVLARQLGDRQFARDDRRHARRLDLGDHVACAGVHDAHQVGILDGARQYDEQDIETGVFDEFERDLGAEVRQGKFAQHDVPFALGERVLDAGRILYPLHLERVAGFPAAWST